MRPGAGVGGIALMRVGLPPFWRRRPAGGFPEIHRTGQQVALRPLRLGDDLPVFEYASDPEVTRFLPWHPAPSLDTVRSFLLQQIARRRRGESYAFAIELIPSKTVIGSTDLMGLDHAEGGCVELGYILGRTFWGRGLMTEAAKLTVDVAFDELSVGRLEAFADTQNIGSCRVLEKVGFRPLGTETRMVKDEERVYMRYGLDRDDWISMRESGGAR